MTYLNKLFRRLFIIILLAAIFSPATIYAMQETDAAIILEASALKGVSPTYQTVTLKVTSGKYKGKVFTIENETVGDYAYDMVVKKGDKVSVFIQKQNGHLNVFIVDYYHQNYILYLMLFFVTLLIVIGRKKGIKSIITLAFTIFVIIKILLPAILLGYNSILVTILLSIAIIVFSMFIIAGINNKSFSAIIGTIGGVLLAGFIAYFIQNKIGLTGLSSDEVAQLIMNMPYKIDFRSLLFPGIVLGALGAVMDVSISIASAVDEVSRANRNLTIKELYTAGMNIGRDIMGTMVNTLILAYSGSAIALFFLFVAYQSSLNDILNLNIVANEIVRSLAESSGLVVSAPLTALISSILIKKNKPHNN